MSFETIAQKSNTGISNSRGYLDNKANTILRPKSSLGISGFLFDIPDTESITLSSDITDHYTENNSFINDHIVRKPITLNLTGFIGELVFRPPAGIQGAIQAILNRLETVDAYTGGKTPGAVQKAEEVLGQAQSAVSAINQTLDTVQNVVGFFEGEGVKLTAQEEAYDALFALWQSAELLTVQTPWFFYTNMAILNITFTQSGESESITDIAINLKEMRIAEVKTVDYNEDLFAVREQIQSGEEEDQGIVKGRDENTSFLFSTFKGE